MMLAKLALAASITATLPQIANADMNPDPYADRTTLRPVALPRGVLEATGVLRWTMSDAVMTDPVDSLLGARMGLGPIEARAGFVLHTRYERDTMRPVLVQSVTAGADYVITPLFTVGADARWYHPFGGDIDQGFDLRADVTRKWILAPSIALIGTAGYAYEQRETRGQVDAASAQQLVIDGIVQVSPVRRLSLDAGVRSRINLAGDLYGDTALLDVGATATVAVVREVDVFVGAGVDIDTSRKGDGTIPIATNQTVALAGVVYRHP